MPAVQELYETELKEQSIGVIGIAQFRTSEEDTVNFIEQNGLTFPNLYDERAEIAARYGVDGVPAYVFIDTDGNVATTSAGAQGVDVLRSKLRDLGGS